MKSVIIAVTLVLICISTVNAEIIVLNDSKKILFQAKNVLFDKAPFKRIKFDYGISINRTKPQIACPAANIYFEARSEDVNGRLSVAHVTMNRVKSSSYPDDVCKVVTQPWQFSWYNDDEVKIAKEKAAWEDALSIARAVFADTIQDPTEGSLYYHRVDVFPSWRNSVDYVATIGAHKFCN